MSSSYSSNALSKVLQFHHLYRKSDSDWWGTCERTNQNPYKEWSDKQWAEWNRLISMNILGQEREEQ